MGVMRVKAVYVSGPYSAPTNVERQRNIHRAWEATARIWGVKGAYPVSPIQNSANMDGAAGADDYEKFLGADLDFLGRCDAVYMLRDWQSSKGARREHARALENGLAVFYEAENGLGRLIGWASASSGHDPLSCNAEPCQDCVEVAAPGSLVLRHLVKGSPAATAGGK
jgi:hypothetical protein